MAFKEKIDTGSGDFVKFDKIGDSVTGVYLGAKEIEGKFGPVLKHTFKTSSGMRSALAKAGSQLSQMLEGEEGNNLKVTFAETKPSGKGNPTKIYKVAIDDNFERLAPEYLLVDEESSEEATPTRPAAPTGTISRTEVLARLQAAKRKN